MRRRFRRFLIYTGVIILLIVILYIYFRYTFGDAIRGLAETQVRNGTSDLINDAIDRQIELENIQYDRIVYFEKDLNGRITALKTNIGEVNTLKTETLNIINDEILESENSHSKSTKFLYFLMAILLILIVILQ